MQLGDEPKLVIVLVSTSLKISVSHNSSAFETMALFFLALVRRNKQFHWCGFPAALAKKAVSFKVRRI